MRFSIWNWNKKSYDLFDSPNGEQPGQRPAPRSKVNDPRGKGRQLESLLPVLPKNAVLVGSSPKPQGRIAIHFTSSAVGLGAYDSLFVRSPWAVLAGIAAAVWAANKLLVAAAKRL